MTGPDNKVNTNFMEVQFSIELIGILVNIMKYHWNNVGIKSWMPMDTE